MDLFFFSFDIQLNLKRDFWTFLIRSIAIGLFHTEKLNKYTYLYKNDFYRIGAASTSRSGALASLTIARPWTF